MTWESTFLNKPQPPFSSGFLGLFLRDLRVLTREFLPFLLRVGMQPLLFLFVFTFILPRMGTGNPMAMAGGVDFGTILLPGLMAVAIMFSGIAAVALPLSSEFGITREIDDRVMCPLPLGPWLWKRSASAPCRASSPPCWSSPWPTTFPPSRCVAHIDNWFLFALVLVLASLLAGSLGLVIGSTVNPKQIGLVFSILVVPITFLGCVYYPWIGPLPEHPLALHRRPLQSHCLYERRPPRRRHPQHWAYALVGYSQRARLLHRRPRSLGTQRLPRQSALVIPSCMQPRALDPARKE